MGHVAARASQKYCVAASLAAPAGRVTVSAKITSPRVHLRVEAVGAQSDDDARAVVRHVGTRLRVCATIGDLWPMQSTTSRARSSAPSAVVTSAAPGRTATDASAVRSRTTPQATSKLS